MNQKIYDKIADLLLYSVNFREGDKIRLALDFNCREIARSLAYRAYARGASWVELEYRDQFLQAAAIAGTVSEFTFPAYLHTKLMEGLEPGWKSIAVLSEAEADVFEGLPTDRSTAYFRAYQKSREPRMKALMNNQFPWTLTYVPSPHMVSLAFPDLSPEEGMNKYWEAVIKVMHLDADDPVQVWHEKMLADEKRTALINDLKPVSLHFKGPGTDLTVGLNAGARWIGGYDYTTSGERFITNIPTEEIFTSPDCRKVEGRVRLTRPFVMHANLGPIPRNAWFEFREGRVTDFGADQGRETLEAFFQLDERSVYTGEIALVDPCSAIASTGMTYYNGLHDENAACHLAFGKAYPFTLTEQRPRSDEELLAMGMNVSTVHEDAMIGGPEVDVTAVLADGTRKDLIRGGKYLI